MKVALQQRPPFDRQTVHTLYYSGGIEWGAGEVLQGPLIENGPEQISATAVRRALHIIQPKFDSW